MKAGMNGLLNLAAVVGIVGLSGAAMAVTKPKTNAPAVHCVNSRNQEIKAATKASECKAPYHWVKTPSLAKQPKVKPVHTLAHAKKHKGRVATSAKSPKKAIAR